MIVSSSARTGTLDRTGASLALSRSAAAVSSRQGQGAAAASTAHVALRGSDAAPVYGDPRVRPGVVRLWAGPVAAGDNVAALMARNRGVSSYALSDQWRGLGGALLKRFAETGEGYAQTLVDELIVAADAELAGLTPEEQARHAASILARQASALGGVATHAPTATMKIQTRSGQSVELRIAVSAGLGGSVGMQVEIKASGATSDAERAAIAQLAEGLDAALEGLGRQDAAVLDLFGLMGYDRDVLAGLDISVDNPQTHQPLSRFALHLGDDKRTVSLKGSDGDMNLSVATGMAPGMQGGAALQQVLDRMGGAGERGRANAALVDQMKAAFVALQSAAGDDDDDDGGAEPNGSGLADFDASFGGDTWRNNRFGSTNEAGQVGYQLSQKTATNGASIAQTVSEQLSADFRKAPGDAMLNVDSGNFSATRVRDTSTVTTLIDTVLGQPARVLRKTDTQQLKTVTDFQDHRVTHQQSWPSQTRLLERLR